MTHLRCYKKSESPKIRWLYRKNVGMEVKTVKDDHIRYLRNISESLDKAKRNGTEEDTPEGSRYIALSHTLVNQISDVIKEIIAEEKNVICEVRLEINQELGYDPDEFTKMEMAYTIKNWDKQKKLDHDIMNAIMRRM